MNDLGATTIHEFSTGIKWTTTRSGGWVSQGFTGGYMHSTLNEAIPHAVGRAIANNQFSVSEGVSTHGPTLVARVVPAGSQGETPWSVLAVVSRGQDDYGRSFSAYRYFLCEGKDGLRSILELFRQKGRVLCFDPRPEGRKPRVLPSNPRTEGRKLDALPSGSPHRQPPDPTSIPVVVHGYPFQDTPPEPDDRHPPSFQPIPTDNDSALINELFRLHDDYAQFLKNRHPQSDLAWAYNVHSLEKPAEFLVIHAASPQAYDLLHRIGSQPRSPQRKNLGDEQAIKAAVQGLIGRSVVKPEHVHTLITAWVESDPTSPEAAAHWQQVFEAQGATKALHQKIQNPQMVRLMTLRAMLCPDTFPAYLTWLQPRLTSRDKSEPQATAEQFLRGPSWRSALQQLKRQNPAVAEALGQSRQNALRAVVKAFPDAALPSTLVLWAWNMPEGFWWIDRQDWHDLSQSLQEVSLSPTLERFCLEVSDGLRSQSVRIPYGNPFYQIAAACRASRSGGFVEADLYDRAFPGSNSPIEFLGQAITRQPKLSERIRDTWDWFLTDLPSMTWFWQISVGVGAVLLVGLGWWILTKDTPPVSGGGGSISSEPNECFLPKGRSELEAANPGAQVNQSSDPPPFQPPDPSPPPLLPTLKSIAPDSDPERQTSLGQLLCLSEGSRQWRPHSGTSDADLSTAITRYQQGLGFDFPDARIDADGLTEILLRSDVAFHPYRRILVATLDHLQNEPDFSDQATAIRAIATVLTTDPNPALTKENYDLAVRLDISPGEPSSGEALRHPRPQAQTDWKEALEKWGDLDNLMSPSLDVNRVAEALVQAVQYSTTVEALESLFDPAQIQTYTEADKPKLENTIAKVLGLKTYSLATYSLETNRLDDKKAFLDRVEAYHSKASRSPSRRFFGSPESENFQAFKAEVQQEFNRPCLRPIQRQFCTPWP